MTTIAYRDGILAADTLISGNTRSGHMRKIGKIGNILYGGCGSASLVSGFMSWVRAGMVGTPILSVMSGDQHNSASGLVFFEDHIIRFEPAGSFMKTAVYYAEGSGEEVALGAMYAGATALEAVRAAAEWDLFTGGEITVLTRD